MSKRRAQLQADFHALKQKFSDSLFQEFSLDGDLFSCKYWTEDSAESHELTFDCTDYPCIAFFSHEPRRFSDGLIKAFSDVISDLQKSVAIISDPRVYGGLRNSKTRRGGSLTHSGDRMDSDEDASFNDSDIQSFSDNSDNELRGSTNSLMDIDGSDLNEDRWQESQSLMKDVANYRAIFGEDSIRVRGMPLLEIVQIDMLISPLDVLSSGTALAWGVDPDSEIIIRVGFSDTMYTLTQRPPSAIEIFQLTEGKKHRFGLSAQMESILRVFLSAHWGLLQSAKVTTLDKSTVEQVRKEKLHGLRSSGKLTHLGFVGLLAERVSAASFHQDEIDIQKLQELVSIGFPEESALNALLAASNDVERATLILLGEEEAPVKLCSIKDSARPTNALDATDVVMSPELAIKAGAFGNATIFPEFGTLVTITEYIRTRIPHLNNYCVICDKPHVFATGNMLKPAVCSRELCIWSFQQLKVGAESAEDVATEAETIDLLICMCTQAAKSTRRDLILEPFPTIFHPDKPDHPVLSDSNKDFGLVDQVLNAMPSVEAMVQADDFGSMKARMDASHPLAFPMLQWIISSNRSHIVRLKPEMLVKTMNTPHQYLLLSAPPEREEKFRELCNKHGSVFAFHGSSIENWHSILRRGLLNASGTKLMTTGAAYGPGIYLSPDSSVSFGYSRMTVTGPVPHPQQTGSKNRFLSSSTVRCIAVCEVIDTEIRKNGSIWVQPHESHVLTRFFFVYTQFSSVPTCSTNTAEFRNELIAAIKYYNQSTL